MYSEDGSKIGKLSDRSPEINKLMHLMFRNQAFYNVDQNVMSFFKNLKDEGALAFFTNGKIASFKTMFRKELEVLAMSLPDICDGFAFEDKQLLSVLGKKHKNDKEMYEEMLDIVRNNPINKNMVPRGFNKFVKPLVHGKL